MRKRAVSLLIALVLLLCSNALTTYAVDVPKFKLVGASGEIGDTICVELYIENNPGITAFSLAVDYPADSLELIGVEPSGEFENGFSSGKLNTNPFKISWYESSSEDVYSEGKVASFRFRILKLDEPAQISISYRANDVFNSSFDNQYFETEAAYVTGMSHNYCVVSFENGIATLKCSDCNDVTEEAFENHINQRGYAPLDMNDDGIVNAKDYAYLIKNY
ncbi:MAG: hypothetical protein IJ927_02110 [Eubacterium sp.]|nr:hypothetical protein [Eubacterium sp.]